MASRIEELLHTLIDGSGKTISPQTSVERLFQDIIDGVTEFDPPTSRFEEMVQIFVQGGTYDNTPTSRAEIILKTAIDGSDEYPEPTNIFEDLLIQWCKIGVGPKWDYELTDIQFDGDNYVRTGIFPYSEENINKDFDCIFNFNFAYSGGEKSFGVFSNFKTGLQNHPVEFWCTKLDTFTIWTVGTTPSFNSKSFSVPNLSGSDIIFKRRSGTYTVEVDGNVIVTFTVDALEDNDEIVVGAFRSSTRNNLYKSNDYLNYFQFKWLEPVSEHTATLGKAVIGKMILGTK